MRIIKHPFFQSPWSGVVGSVLSGVLLALSFPGVGQSILAYTALIPLLFAVQSVSAKRAVWLGLLSGLVFYLLSLSWLGNLPGVVESWGLKVTASLGYVTLAGYCSLYLIPFVLVANLGIKRWVGDDIFSNVLFIFALSATWAAAEYGRSVLLTGFPWNALGISQYNSPTLIQVAHFGGVYLVSAILVWMNAALFVTFRQYTHGTRLRKYRPHFELMAGLLPVALSMMYGLNEAFSRPEPTESVRVGLVQPNVTQTLKWDESMRADIWNRLRILTDQVIHVPSLNGVMDLDLVVWPETAIPELLDLGVERRGAVRLTTPDGTPLLVGVNSRRNGRYYNSSVLYGEDGAYIDHYDKQHLVPFGEYVPFGLMRKFTAVDFDIARGTESTLLAVPGRASFSVLICFEDTVAPLSADAVKSGARWLVNQTNDGWFDPSSQSEQHLAHAVFRCVENRVPMVRCCNTGVSCLIDSFGNISDRIGAQSQGISVAQLVPRYKIEHYEGDPFTYYTRHGDVFAKACLWVSAIALFILVPKKKTRRKKDS